MLRFTGRGSSEMGQTLRSKRRAGKGLQPAHTCPRGPHRAEDELPPPFPGANPGTPARCRPGATKAHCPGACQGLLPLSLCRCRDPQPQHPPKGTQIPAPGARCYDTSIRCCPGKSPRGAHFPSRACLPERSPCGSGRPETDSINALQYIRLQRASRQYGTAQHCMSSYGP